MSMHSSKHSRLTRKTPDNEKIIDSMVRKILEDVRRRGVAFAYGELTIRISFEAGAVKHFKVQEETIFKPGDEETTEAKP